MVNQVVSIGYANAVVHLDDAQDKPVVALQGRRSSVLVYPESGVWGGGSGTPGPQGPVGPGVPTGGTAGQVLTKASSANYDAIWAAGGTVTSVSLTMPAGFSVAGSPITNSGTFAVTTTLNGYVKGNGTGFTAAATVPTSDLTGTLAAVQFPALTGDVTTVAGALGTTIANSAVTLAKMADVATGTVFYRKTTGTGAPEVQTLATLKTDLGLTGTNSGDQTITLTGDVTGSGTGSFAATLATVNSNVGTFGSASLVPVITVNGKGLITAVSTVSIPAASSPGGSSGQFQFNNAGAFGGATGLTWDSVNSRVGVNNASPARLFEVTASGTGIPARLGNSQGNFDIGGSDGVVVILDSRSWATSLQTGGVERLRITTGGNIHPPAGTTSMTNGFIYIPAAAGAPSGAATAISGTVPLYYDTTNNQLYIYNGGWKKVALA